MIGRTLGPYQVVDKLGAGGMGEVYRAKDARLNRTVAIKVLSGESATDPDRRERFEREAKAISALDHPNICPLYDVGDHDGTYFLVMPCLEGQTLAERLTKGALPVDQAIKIAIEIATALDAAHRHGIVHRDLKPGNVMLTKAGVKLLDFGLAKLKKAPGPLTYSGVAKLAGETTHASGTGIGTLLGTMPYMAPEQVEGREVDARSDIFALGAVIYEMVTGTRAFKGDSPASVIGSILKDEPAAMTKAQPLAPAALDHMVTTCLAKDPDERWQSAADISRELKWIQQSPAATQAQPRASSANVWVKATAAALAIAGIVAVLAWPAWRRSEAPISESIRFRVPPPPGYTFVGGTSSISVLQFSVSPDGRYLVFVSSLPGVEPTLWLRPLNDLAGRELTGSSGAIGPFWSSDSRSVGFFAGGRLKTINIGTGELRDIAPASRSPRGAAWSSDGVILMGGDSGMGLSKVSVSTGLVEVATRGTEDANSHRWPSFLPGGRRFLYYARGTIDHRGIYVGSLDGDAPVRVLETAYHGQYANGFLLTMRQGVLLAYPFDERTATITGDPVQVANRIGGSSTQHAAFSASDTGILVHTGDSSEISRLTWFDRSGRETDSKLPTANIPTFRLSPDGRQVATARMDPILNTTDIWITDFDRTASTRFTLDPANDFAPVWSQDGKQIAFRSDRSGMNLLYRKASIGGTLDEQVSTFDASNPSDWSPDGRHILFFQALARTSADVGLAALNNSPQPAFILNTVFDEYDGRYSPDGRWIAYVSNESGRSEVYVQPYPITGSKWIVSSGGGTEPRWRGDGRELFYLAGGGRLMSVMVDTNTVFRASQPRDLFQTRIPPARNFYQTSVDATADGQRFLIKTPVDDASSPSLTVVTNWTVDLARR